MVTRQPTRAKRPRYEMPDYIRDALLDRGLMAAYLSRPSYQQNDYIGWITRAKLPRTRVKRLAQMLVELAIGNKYMNMDYHPRHPG